MREFLGLERNLLVLLGALVLLGLGEELWSSFVPKYLEALGAGVFVWSAYQALKDLLDAIYQYPGGFVADRLGRRRALVLFNLLAIVGYGLYLFGAHWGFILIGALFVAAWGSMSLPATFAIVGDELGRGRRAIGFSVQSIVKRLPIVIAPVLGGLLLQNLGVISGFQAGLAVTIVLALAALIFQQRTYRERPMSRAPQTAGVLPTFRGFPPALKRLLISDILARLAQGIPAALVVIYITTELGASVAFFGSLRGLQMLTAILLYIPAGKLADRWGQAPFISLTFAFFALFPLAFALYPLVPGLGLIPFLILAHLIAGLREIGEPARKAMIVDLVSETHRGEAVGVYYLVRGLSVAGAPFVGGILWTQSPQLAFAAAAGLGLLGTVWYLWQGPKTVQSTQEYQEQ
jgi:MFS family permease